MDDEIEVIGWDPGGSRAVLVRRSGEPDPVLVDSEILADMGIPVPPLGSTASGGPQISVPPAQPAATSGPVMSPAPSGELESPDPLAPTNNMSIPPAERPSRGVRRNTGAPQRPVQGSDILMAGYNELLAGQRAGSGASRAAARGLRQASGQAAQADANFRDALGNTFLQESQGLQALAQEEARVNEELERLESVRNQMETERQELAQRELNQLEQVVGRASQLRIDPQRALGDPFSSTRIGAAIAVALNSAAQAFGNVQNSAFAHIQGMIDNDITAQKAALDQAQTEVGNRTNLYRMMRETFDDQRQSELATKVVMLEQAQQRVKALLAGNASQQVLANGAAILADMDRAKAAAQLAFFQQAMQRGRGRRLSPEFMMTQLNRIAELRNSELKMQSEEAIAGAENAPRPVFPGSFVVDPATYQNLTDEETAKMRGVVAGARALDGSMHRLIAMSQQISRQMGTYGRLDRNLMAEAEQLAEQVKLDIAQAYEFGALQDGEIRLLDMIAKNPTELTIGRLMQRDDVTHRLESARATFRRNARERTFTHGLNILWGTRDPGGTDADMDELVRQYGGR